MIYFEIYYNGGNSDEYYNKMDWYLSKRCTSYEDEAAAFMFELMREDTDNFALSHRFEIVVGGVEDFDDYHYAHLFACELYWLLEEHCPTYDPDNLEIRFEV